VAVHYHSGVNILALDTSTEACSAAILREDGSVFSEFDLAPRQHTRLLPLMIDAVLSASALSRQDLTHCAFSNGPGSFTGIRIAASRVQGIAIALAIPVIPVSTLAVLAQTCFDKYSNRKALVALDARMAEIYWANYNNDSGYASLSGFELLSAGDKLFADVGVDYGAGHGWAVESAKSLKEISFPIDDHLLPDASALLKLAQIAVDRNQAVSADKVEINYLRNKVAEKISR
jgi:tRNA threonylcarbamoyladenosine biosynthesis protein TsaB